MWNTEVCCVNKWSPFVVQIILLEKITYFLWEQCASQRT